MRNLILQLDISGQPKRWISYDKATYYYSKNAVVWEAGNDVAVYRGGINRCSQEQSAIRVNSIIATTGKISNNQNRQTLTNELLFKRDGNICCYCNREFKSCELTRDHIVATSRNGPNTWDNVVTSCKPCNCYKSDRTLQQVGLSLEYPPFSPSYAEYMVLTNTYMRDDQYEFLRNLIPETSRIVKYYKRK